MNLYTATKSPRYVIKLLTTKSVITHMAKAIKLLPGYSIVVFSGNLLELGYHTFSLLSTTKFYHLS